MPRRHGGGNGGFGGIPSQTFTGSDGEEFFLVASTPAQWRGVADALERPDLLTDERFADVSARIANRDVVIETLDRAFAARPARSGWTSSRARRAGEPGQRHGRRFANPQIRHRNMRMTIEHPVAGPIDLLRNPIVLGSTPITDYAPPPTLGQHTREVLATELGMSDEQIDKLVADRTV